jgi:integrase/recombinase XerD
MIQPLPQLKVISMAVMGDASAQRSAEPLDLRVHRIEEFLRSSNLAPNSQRAYRAELQRFATWSQKAWIDINPWDLSKFKHFLKIEAQTPKGQPLAASSINQAITALKSFYRWFQLAGYLPQGEILPTAALQFEKLDKPLPRHLSPDQMAAIAHVLEQGEQPLQLRDRALLAILTHGLRASDVSALNVENFDGLRLRFVRGKDKSEGSVPLRAAAREQLEAYLAWRSLEEVLTGESPLLLSHDFRTDGQRLGYQGIYYFTKRLGVTVGIADLTPHRFRHTYASSLVEMGIDTLLARTLTGHKSERVFERYVIGKRVKAAEDAFLNATGEMPPESEEP